MRIRLLWRLLAALLLVIAIGIVISDILITRLAAQSFMQIMARYHIDPTPVETAFLATVHNAMFISGGVAAAAALLLGWTLVRPLIGSIADMMVLSERIAEGDYGRRIEPHGPEELVRLAEALNRMAGALEHVEALRRDLVANIAHELRTPLSTLQGYLEALRDGVTPPSRATLASLHEEVLRLVRLVDALHQLSQFDAEVSQIDRAELDVGALVRRVVGAYGEQFNRRHLTVREAYDPTCPPVAADADLIGQALRNLLDNALRYAPPGAEVTVRTTRVDGAVRIEVQNTGSEIPADDLPHIFERFYRGEKSRSRETGGAGIGLALVREIARVHAGAVGATSAHGTTSVWLVLPSR